MSKLIQLRQRSKAIETIKKITHAMRLISMSTHSHLQHLQDSLTRYTREVDQLFTELMLYAPKWDNPIIHPGEDEKPKNAIILIGSQKGLCGSFNTQLFKLFHQYLSEHHLDQFDLITVGQKAADFSKQHKQGTDKQSYEKFTVYRLISIARDITQLLINEQPHYTSVLIFANYPKSFFIQKPELHDLVPFKTAKPLDMPNEKDLTWEESPETLLDILMPQYLEAKLQDILFQSLVAEHSARFISMDSATRNAKDLLEANNLEYNKLRQAKITKELTELIGSYK